MNSVAQTTVNGTLFYRQRIALPPDAFISVELAYQPTDGGDPEIVGYTNFLSEGRQVPLPFSVPYDPDDIDGRRIYFIQARIDHHNAPFAFVSAERFPVITHGRPTTGIEVMMQSAPRPTAVVSGSVLYRERIALMPDSVLIVRLQDVSLADAPARVLGEQKVVTGGRQVPLLFEVPYDPAQIDQRGSYSIAARIEDADGRLRFISDSHNAVLTRGYPGEGLEVWVRSV